MKPMLKKEKILLCAGLALALCSGASAQAASHSARGAEDAKVAQLIRLMDKDKNGVVSKDEFMRLMSAEFDRADSDKSGGLTAAELSRSVLATRNGRAELKTTESLITLMDRNHTGAVEKDEFLQFVSEEFDRLDVDKSGTLTRQELSNSVFVRPQYSHPGGIGR